MAAAITASAHDIHTVVLDEQQQSGGQIYRGLEHCTGKMEKILGQDYLQGKNLLNAMQLSSAETMYGATVWRVGHDGTVTLTQNGNTQQIQARRIIIATGALERPCPVPGWTLPGVMTAGAAQILLKTSGLAIENTVLAGTGPLLYTVAVQLINSGIAPRAIVDTQQRSHYMQAARYLPAALANASVLLKGLRLLRTIKSAGVPFYRAAHSVRINGTDCADEIQFVNGKTPVTLKTRSVLLHQGVVPNTQISRSLRLEHKWNMTQRCFHPVTDRWGKSSSELISIAGDGGGIGGADTAELQGRIAALAALETLGVITKEHRNTSSKSYHHNLLKQNSFRLFLDTLYPPSTDVIQPRAQSIVCRCEGVTAGDIRAYAALGCLGPNQTKAFGRCGMGPCQGRYCGLTVTEILAKAHNLSHENIGAYRIRSPIKPVTLAELANFDSN